jgi:hypothetical protein
MRRACMCGPHVELSWGLWCSIVRPVEVRRGVIIFLYLKNTVGMGLIDVNRSLLL